MISKKTNMLRQALFLLFLSSQHFFQVVSGCGRYEFYMWEDLPESLQQAAEKLNYNEELWNFIGSNVIEKFALSDLINGITLITLNNEGVEEEIEFQLGKEELEALKELDLYDDSDDPGLCWDHYVNHYMGYAWDEITEEPPLKNPFGNDISEALEILGWNKEMWDSDSTTGEIPESDCKAWFDLTPDEQWALQSMGWTGMKWMHYPLGKLVQKIVWKKIQALIQLKRAILIILPSCNLVWKSCCTLDPRCPPPPVLANNFN